MVRIIGVIILRILPPYWGGGGQWEQVKDTFILAAGDKYSQGQTGGEATHTLSIDEMPSHYHDFKFKSAWDWNSGSSTGDFVNSDVYVWTSELTNYNYIKMTKDVGGSKAHNNMPPYRVAYCYRRIA